MKNSTFMKNSTMLFLATIAMTGSFSAIKTEFTPQEQYIQGKMQNLIDNCDKRSFHQDIKEIELLINSLTSVTIKAILSSKHNNAIAKDTHSDCEDCKALISIFDDVLGKCNTAILNNQSNLTIQELMESEC